MKIPMDNDILDADQMWDEGFCEYRNFMFEAYDKVVRNRGGFITDEGLSLSFKNEVLEDLLDFFGLEEECSRCEELKKIQSALILKHLMIESIV